MGTNSPLKAGALILDNLAMFNEAAILMEQQIETRVFEEVQDIVQEWARNNDCEGEMEWIDGNENMWFAPKQWYLSPEEEILQLAAYWFAPEDNQTNSYNVADFCGCGQTRMGFVFGASDELGKKKGWKKAWKQACEALPETSLQELESLGFTYINDVGGLWFLPTTLDNHKLAFAYENDDYDDVMEPLLRALGTIKKSIPIFTQLITILPTYL